MTAEQLEGGWLNVGTLSNCIAFAVMLTGLLLVVVADCDNLGCKLLLSAGLFGFAGGVTNCACRAPIVAVTRCTYAPTHARDLLHPGLAVKMLFDRIPFLYGSGIIPARFKEIRQTVKDTIMVTFFDEEYLVKYLDTHIPKFLDALDLPGKLEAELAKPDTDALIEAKLNEVVGRGDSTAQVLMMASMAMGGVKGMVPHIKPLLVSFGKELAAALASKFNTDVAMQNVDKLRLTLDNLMEEKLRACP